jgi:hypothetical protein
MPSPKVIFDRLLKGPTHKGMVAWKWRSEVSPANLYCYLGARFGKPNGPQNFLRNDRTVGWVKVRSPSFELQIILNHFHINEMALLSTNKKGVKLCFFHTSKLFERTWALRGIERRFPRSLVNFLHVFSHKVDRCTCFMNDGESPILVFEQKGRSRDILHEGYYQQLLASIAKLKLQ